jgi:hypothetical protein
MATANAALEIAGQTGGTAVLAYTPDQTARRRVSIGRADVAGAAREGCRLGRRVRSGLFEVGAY